MFEATEGDNCAFCNTNVKTTFFGPNTKPYCADCIRLLYPPTLSLITFPGTDRPNVFNLNCNKYESQFSIEDLSWCGWGMRMCQKLESGAVVVLLEYHGKANCGRCMHYDWGLSGQRCLTKVCEEYVIPRMQRSFPYFKSLWMQSKFGAKNA